MNFTTAKQVSLRQTLTSDQQIAFDVEYSRKRLSKVWFGLLWGFVGFFFGHSVYFFLKTKDLSKKESVAATWLWIGPVMVWSGSLFAPVCVVLGIFAVICSGFYFLLSAEFDRLNDEIAQSVVSDVKRTVSRR
jgi:hypothetical protein